MLNLDSFIDSAEQTILPLLTQYQSSVTFANVTDSVIYFTTMRPNYFVPGQSVVVTGAGTYSATYTVTDDRIEPYTFTAATAEADRDYPLPFIPAATATLSGSSAAQLYANTPPIENAILVVAVEIFQSITAPGNQIMSDNFQPSPFILGRSLSNRVIGLLGPFLDVENDVPMTIEADIRTPLQTALSTIAANVYNGIPETMTSSYRSV
jgi:hypothetical protein